MTEYEKKAQNKLDELRGKKDVIILAIESSCDETAAAVLKGKTVLSNCRRLTYTNCTAE